MGVLFMTFAVPLLASGANPATFSDSCIPGVDDPIEHCGAITASKVSDAAHPSLASNDNSHIMRSLAADDYLDNEPDFEALLTTERKVLLFNALVNDNSLAHTPTLTEKQLQTWSHQWQCTVRNHNPDDDFVATEWLIKVFNQLFYDYQVVLIRGTGEPEYIAAKLQQPARIEFAHGFFASALHEISHWCIAGKYRRTLDDYGYWYAADGRSQAQQQLFEQVEIKPQAIECLFSLLTDRPFRVSQDNLFADFDTSNSTFASDVYQQVQAYLRHPTTLPRDAKVLILQLLKLCHGTDVDFVYETTRASDAL